MAEVVRKQHVARHAKAATEPNESAREAERARAEKGERDRALAQERKAQLRIAEMRAQARQIIQDKHLRGAGESEYRYSCEGAIRTILVGDEHRKLLSAGALVIARLGEAGVLLPRAAADKVRERDAGMIVLDHGLDADTAATADASAMASEDDAYYAQLQVPDDLVW